MVTHTEDPQKPSKKPLIYYYILAMIVLLLLNALLFPSSRSRWWRCPITSSWTWWTKAR